LRQKITFIIGLVIVALLGGYLTFSMNRYLNRPKPQTWHKIYSFVVKQKQEGDAMAFFPSWLAGYALDNSRFEGIGGVTEKDIFNSNNTTFDRVWIIYCFDAFNEEKMASSEYKLTLKQTIDSVKVLLYVRQKRKISYRLTDNVLMASMGFRSGIKKNNKIGASVTQYITNSSNEFAAGWSIFRRLAKRGLPIPLTKDRETILDLGILPPGNFIVCGGITDQGLFSMDFDPIHVWVWSDNSLAGYVQFKAKSGWYCSKIFYPNDERYIRLVLASDVKKKREFLFDAFVI